jgi:Domain of unknown function (DUF4153)
MQHRLIMAGLGALAGLSLYLLAELVKQDILPERASFGLGIFMTAFFGAVLALAGPLRLRQSIGGAAVVAVVVCVLMSWTGLRFDTVEDVFNGPMHAMAAFALCTLPLPFILAWFGAGLRHYPTLFSGAWGIIVRGGTAFVFTGVVWGTIMLSDLLLGIVGLSTIDDILNVDIVPWLITGVTLGIALAVVEELRDYISPHLILRLMRFLVPVVLMVMVVFCVALPIQGFAGVFEQLSAATTLLTMTAAAATLVSVAIDQDDAQATQSPVLTISTRALALILPVPAMLAAYAMWLRVGQYGWTPERLFAALVAIVALGYALFYCVSVVRRGAWMARVRQVNILMAAVVIGFSGLWLTPILNAERISAGSQVARFEAGILTAADIEPYDYNRWGKAGAALLLAMNEKAKEPGQKALADRLAGATAPLSYEGQSIEDLRRALVAVLPIQPANSATARDRVLAAFTSYDLQNLLDACRLKLPDGTAGCAMIFADMLPAEPGDEAVVASYYGENYGNFEAIYVKDGNIIRASAVVAPGTSSFQDNAAGMIRAMQMTVAKVRPVPMNMVDVGGFGLMAYP